MVLSDSPNFHFHLVQSQKFSLIFSAQIFLIAVHFDLLMSRSHIRMLLQVLLKLYIFKYMYRLLIFFMYNLCQKSTSYYQIVVPSTSRSPKFHLPTTMIYAYIPHTIFFTPPVYLYIRPKI